MLQIQYFYIICAACLWGLIGIFSKKVFSEGIAPLEIAFWRALLAWICFAICAIIKRETKFEKKDVPFLIIFAFFCVSIFYVSYQYAVKTGGAALASILLYTAPAWVILTSRIVFKEKFTKIKIICFILTMSGIIAISTGDKNVSFIAIASGLIAGICYSFYFTFGKYFSKKYTSTTLFFYTLPIGIIGILPFVEFHHKTNTAWFFLILLALFSTFLANSFYYLGLKSLEAGKASLIATIEPVVAAILAYIIFGEVFSLIGYIGVSFIIIAVMLIIIKS